MFPIPIYIGTGGYSDTDLLGTLYPHGTPKSEFLAHYAQHYDCVEINSTFHAPIGQKSLMGMLAKSSGSLKFSLKLHQDFSHKRIANAQNAKLFLQSLQPLIQQNALANLLIQFPMSFERTPHNRRYLANVCEWFSGCVLAMEFRHPSWHIETVFAHFHEQNQLIWCNVDYPKNIGLPEFHFQSFGRTAYLRLHGHNPNWHTAQSAAERHNYRYTNTELLELANVLLQNKNNFDEAYIYFQNTTQSHSFHNIPVLKGFLADLGFAVKTPKIELAQQQSLF